MLDEIVGKKVKITIFHFPSSGKIVYEGVVERNGMVGSNILIKLSDGTFINDKYIESIQIID